MKKRSGRNLIRFFYHLLVVLVMAMPMLSGLVRIIYVQSNQNAFESYSGEVYKTLQPIYYQSNEVESNNDLVVGNIYYFAYKNPQPTQQNAIKFKVADLIPISYTNSNTYSTSGSSVI